MEPARPDGYPDASGADRFVWFVVEVPFALRSKSNFRRHRRGAASGSWAAERAFEEAVAVLVRAGRPDHWDVGDAQDPVAGRPVVVAYIAARSTVDAANFSKSIVDAGEGSLYVSDASVLGVAAVGVRGRGERTVVGFAQLPAGSSPAAVASALAELGRQVVDRFTAGD